MADTKPTKKQAEYLAFIHTYTTLHGRPPAETDLRAYFKVSPPSVHQMILTLERRGFISRVPRAPRSIRILVPPEKLPPLGHSIPGASGDPVVELVVETAVRVIDLMFDQKTKSDMDDAEFAPLVQCVAEAVEAQLVTRGHSKREAARARVRVEESAITRYVRLCVEVDPDGSDAAQDEAIFRYLMEHGEWPE